MLKRHYILIPILLLFILFDTIGQSHPGILIDIDLASPDELFAINGNDLEKNLNYEVHAGQNFSMNILNSGGLNPEYYLIVNSSNSHRYSTQNEFEITRSLNEGEELNLRIKLPGVPDNKIWNIKVTTEELVKPNSSFAYISAIRSIDGEDSEGEFFDAFFKFNLSIFPNDGSFTNAFNMAAFEFNFSESDTSTTTDKLEEAMFSINRFLVRRSVLKNGMGSIKRTGFVGAGAKVFDNRVYLGAHLGIIEVSGGFFTSYLFVGYYHDPYAAVNPLLKIDSGGNTILDDEGNPITREFRNNIYAEFAVQAEDSNVEIISDIRLKVGILFPLRGSEQTPDTKPTENDIKHRITLEIPLGKIFKF